VLALAVWFSASAVVPSLRAEWGIDATEAVWLTASVQIGFVLGAVASALANLADRVRPAMLLAASALGAALCTIAFAALADGLSIGVPLRLATGVFLAGVYPVGMKLMASWSPTAIRARSIGILLAALTVGSALPQLIGVLALDWRAVMLVAGALTMAGAAISAFALTAGPHVTAAPGRPDPAYLLTMVRDRSQLLANLGYFGHMWELYALWTWLPTFVLSGASIAAGPAASLAMFLAIGVAGAAGCVAGGRWADRVGRERTAAIALGVSGGCCVLSPLAFGLPWLPLLAFSFVWGAAVIADSGVFSTLVSEIAEPRLVGTALTTQTAIGFLVTVVTIQGVPAIAAATGWRFAFLPLAVGPLVGVIAMVRLRRRRRLTLPG
jgi:MFS family permease